MLCAAAASELGLAAGTPVAQGGIDAYLGMLGLGAVGPGDLAMIMGSSTCHIAMSERELLGSGMLGCYPDAVLEGVYTDGQHERIRLAEAAGGAGDQGNLAGDPEVHEGLSAP